MEQIRLGNDVFEGRNSVYLFDTDRTVLVDTGIGSDDSRRELADKLNDTGVDFTDVDEVLLTHYHGDHAGLAAALHEEAGATIHVHEDDADLVRGDSAAWQALYDLQQEYFEDWGMPQAERDTLVERMEMSGEEMYSGTLPVETFTDGDRFDVGETTLEVVHSPGHTAGLSSFAMTDRNEVLSGDAVLPVYTPNVGGADVRVDRPLSKYVQTLDRLAERQFDRAWPGHRDVIDEPSERARFIQEHHGERALRVVRVLADRGAADAWTVSADLFGDLSGIHVLHGPGEASAHLEHLVDVGDVVQDGREYSLTDDAREKLAGHEADTWPLRVDGTALEG